MAWPYQDWSWFSTTDCDEFDPSIPGSVKMQPDFGTHKDFRSPSIPKKRRRKDTTKYYSHRAVHPSWVGKEYYDIQLVSSTVHTVHAKPKSRRHNNQSFHVTHIVEKDEPARLDALVCSGTSWNYFSNWWIPPQIHVAVAQAKVVDVSLYPFVVPDPHPKPSTTEELFDYEDPNNPRSIERIPIELPAPIPDTMPDNLALKLRVKKWTKQDNFTTKSHFIWGPDRRHHHGKRKVREKHLQKWNEKELGRGQKEKGKNLMYQRMGCGYPYSYWHRVFLYSQFKEYREDVWERWDRDSFDETCYLDDDEEFLGSNWRDIEGEAWHEDEYFGDHWRVNVDEVALLWKVIDWRKEGCDYEGMDGYEDDTLSIGSDVVVLEQVVDAETDADVDVMSDMAELIVNEEWDVLSETSGVSESYLSIE